MITFQGVDPGILANKLDRVVSNVVEATGHDIGEALADSAENRIQGEKRRPYPARRWRAWKRSYAATRGPGHSLGIDTGKMSKSVEFNVMTRRVEVGSTVKYAKFFQAARPFLGVSVEDRKTIRKIIAEEIGDQLR